MNFVKTKLTFTPLPIFSETVEFKIGDRIQVDPEHFSTVAGLYGTVTATAGTVGGEPFWEISIDGGKVSEFFVAKDLRKVPLITPSLQVIIELDKASKTGNITLGLTNNLAEAIKSVIGYGLCTVDEAKASLLAAGYDPSTFFLLEPGGTPLGGPSAATIPVKFKTYEEAGGDPASVDGLLVGKLKKMLKSVPQLDKGESVTFDHLSKALSDIYFKNAASDPSASEKSDQEEMPGEASMGVTPAMTMKDTHIGKKLENTSQELTPAYNYGPWYPSKKQPSHLCGVPLVKGCASEIMDLVTSKTISTSSAYGALLMSGYDSEFLSEHYPGLNKEDL